MLWPGVATSAMPQGACNPKTGDTCDFEMDFETSIFIQRQKRATLAGAGTAPALPCSSSLSESTWEKRHKLNSVFFQLYGANMTQSGMAPFEATRQDKKFHGSDCGSHPERPKARPGLRVEFCTVLPAM